MPRDRSTPLSAWCSIRQRLIPAAQPPSTSTCHRLTAAWSPVDGVAYPAVMLVTGEHDGRVNPANSRRMAARLQAATTSGRPVLLRTSESAGHGVDTALGERIAEDTDVFAFLIDQLGVAVPQRSSSPG